MGKGFSIESALLVVDEDSEFGWHNRRARGIGRHILGVVLGVNGDSAKTLYGCRNAGLSTIIAWVLIKCLKFRIRRGAVLPEGMSSTAIANAHTGFQQ